MRKRNCDKLFDNIFWYTLYFLPVIFIFGIYFSVYRDTGTLPAPIDILNTLVASGSGDFGMDMFSTILTEFAIEYFYVHNTNIPIVCALACMGHFIVVYIFHLFVDFLLFIPRLCHKWMNTLTQGD